MQKRRFVPGALNHIFFISRDGGVLFYLTSDRLFFYSLLAVLARRHKVVIVGICIMYTHVHLMVRAKDLAQLRAFMGQLLRALSLIFRKDRGLEGPILKTPFGSAPRVDSKSQRSSLIYLFNNPVEKHLCTQAVADRWTFLAYYEGNPSPFSVPLVKRKSSQKMRDKCALIDAEFAAGRFLRPAFLRGLSRGLSKEEQEQLVDYIVVKYQCIDYRSALEIFDGYDKLIQTTDMTTGKEFEIGEEFSNETDSAYADMIRLAANARLFEGWQLLHLDSASQKRYARIFRNEAHATEQQICKFLHLSRIPQQDFGR